MIEICSVYFLKILIIIVQFCNGDNETNKFGLYPSSDLIPDLYNIYMEAVKRGTICILLYHISLLLFNNLF